VAAGADVNEPLHRRTPLHTAGCSCGEIRGASA